MWSVQTKELLGEKEGVRKLSCVKLDWSGPDRAGRRTFKEIPGSAFELRADLVLLRWGSSTSSTARWSGTWASRRTCGEPRHDRNCMTNVPGCSAPGRRDGGVLVVSAINLGRLAAAGRTLPHRTLIRETIRSPRESSLWYRPNPFIKKEETMRRRVMLAATVICLAAPGFLHAAPWEFDPDHTGVHFKVRHLMVSSVRGNSKKSPERSCTTRRT